MNADALQIAARAAKQIKPAPEFQPRDQVAIDATFAALFQCFEITIPVIRRLGVNANHFDGPDREIFESVLAVNSRGEIVDDTSVRDELARRGTLEGAGGWARLRDLTVLSIVPTDDHIEHHARCVIEDAITRDHPYLRDPRERAKIQALLDQIDVAPEELETPKRRNPEWPSPLGPEARNGLLGDVLSTIGPNTEADEAAIAFQFVVAAGAMFGRESYFRIEADRHHANTYMALIQDTGTGKGVSWGHVLALLSIADPQWIEANIVSGLSTGEGLIAALRDPETTNGDDEDGDAVSVVMEQTDKRLLITEPELGRVLTVMNRDGATLSAIMRQAFDSGNMRVITRKDPLKATGAHVSLISHITSIELKRTVSTMDLSNGWGNRILWVVARRARLLPLGGHVDQHRLQAIGQRLQDAVRFAREGGEVLFDPDAERAWVAVYPDLVRTVPGVFGAVRERGRAHVIRLSLILALLDLSRVIRPVHLRAALELWRHSEDSARYLFGDLTGDRVADDVLTELRARPEGLTTTQLHELFHHNRSRTEINRAIETLRGSGLARMAVKPNTGGRPAHRYFAVYDNELNEGNELRGE